MELPEPQSISFSTLMNNIEKGLIKLPQFQRDFVWTKQKSAKLLDSIIKGYPIGTFILWKTKESLRSIRNLGDAKLPKTPSGDFVQYVLDGQQRLTSLYASLKGLKIGRDSIVDDFSKLYVDLSASQEEDMIITDISEKIDSEVIRLTDLLYGGLTFLADFPKKHHKKLEDYKNRIDSHMFSTILIKETSIDVATEIFTRINVTGKPLSVFEIMVAKTFDQKKNFDLAEKYNVLIDKLGDVDYETISDATILQTISMILAKECSKKVILKLSKKEFIEVWPDAVDAIKSAVDYFRNYYRIPVSKLLPYNALVVLFAYFFYHHKRKPTGKKQQYLEDLFWRCSLSGRYSSSLETKLAQDIKRIDIILEGKLPKYDFPVDIRPEFIKENGWFSAGRSYIKAILCIYAFNEPKSFIDNSIVRISNDWLKQANSKNYHHFFPKAYLKKIKEDDFYINHIANITIVDDFLNKHVIKAKSPAQYLKSFEKKNEKLKNTLKTHMINLDTFGVWENNYQKFFDRRVKAISRRLKQKIISQEIDKKGQDAYFDDFEETELST